MSITAERKKAKPGSMNLKGCTLRHLVRNAEDFQGDPKAEENIEKLMLPLYEDLANRRRGVRVGTSKLWVCCNNTLQNGKTVQKWAGVNFVDGAYSAYDITRVNFGDMIYNKVSWGDFEKAIAEMVYEDGTEWIDRMFPKVPDSALEETMHFIDA